MWETGSGIFLGVTHTHNPMLGPSTSKNFWDPNLCPHIWPSDQIWHGNVGKGRDSQGSAMPPISKGQGPSVPCCHLLSTRITSEFNVGDSLVQGFRHTIAYQGTEVPRSDFYQYTGEITAGCPTWFEPRFTGRKSITLTTEPWLLLA